MEDGRMDCELVRISKIVEMLQRSRASIYRDIQKGEFPKPLKIGNSSRWLLAEIQDYVAACGQSRSAT